MRSCSIAKLALVVVGLILLAWIISPARIIPPSNPANPIFVYVLDYGLHSSLVLPTSNDELIEYAYGDWNYFALNQQNWINGLAALFIPTQGTLGRRRFSNLRELQQIIQQANSTFLSFEVDKKKVAELLKILGDRFDHNLSTSVQNPHTGLTLVYDEQDYTLFQNSNHKVVVWLETLDCQVKGSVIWAHFRVKEESREQGAEGNNSTNQSTRL
jgi:hypothetical protein